MRKVVVIAAAVAMLAGPSLGVAAPCKDAKGRFVKCPPAAPAKGIVKDAKGKCHIASGPKKGQFVKCP